MTESLTLDTSGAVPMGRGESMGFAGINLTWDDIGALPYGQLAQGYIVAAFASIFDGRPVKGFMPYANQPDPATIRTKAVGFSDLAPATLARILKDCASFENIAVGLGLTKLGEREGRYFYAGRNNGTLQGAFAAAFPPLTFHLADDGLIYFGAPGALTLI